MATHTRKNQKGFRGYPSYNDQGVVTTASKFRWHRSRGHWNGKTWAKTVEKRRNRREGKREARRQEET